MDGNSTLARSAIESYDNARSTIVPMQTGITVHEGITIVCVQEDGRKHVDVTESGEQSSRNISRAGSVSRLSINKLESYLISNCGNGGGGGLAWGIARDTFLQASLIAALPISASRDDRWREDAGIERNNLYGRSRNIRVAYTDVYRVGGRKRDYALVLTCSRSVNTHRRGKRSRLHSRCVYFVAGLSGVNDDGRHRLRARDSLVCSILIAVVLEFHFHFLL